MDIEGASTLEDIEVTKIFYDSNAYPTLLGNEWDANMNGLINLKKRKMIFKKKSLRVIIPLDPTEGSRYTELVCDYESDDDFDCIYKVTTQNQDWVNPTADGQIAWEHESSCTSDSDAEMRQW